MGLRGVKGQTDTRSNKPARILFFAAQAQRKGSWAGHRHGGERPHSDRERSLVRAPELKGEACTKAGEGTAEEEEGIWEGRCCTGEG